MVFRIRPAVDWLTSSSSCTSFLVISFCAERTCRICSSADGSVAEGATEEESTELVDTILFCDLPCIGIGKDDFKGIVATDDGGSVSIFQSSCP